MRMKKGHVIIHDFEVYLFLLLEIHGAGTDKGMQKQGNVIGSWKIDVGEVQ
jgi:hypothetical protein